MITRRRIRIFPKDVSINRIETPFFIINRSAIASGGVADKIGIFDINGAVVCQRRSSAVGDFDGGCFLPLNEPGFSCADNLLRSDGCVCFLKAAFGNGKFNAGDRYISGGVNSEFEISLSAFVAIEKSSCKF